MHVPRSSAALVLFTMLLLPRTAAGGVAFDVSVVVNGEDLRVYAHRGTDYVEALRGKAYALRVTNPTGERVAVALSVDGLNTIDARHTDAWSARKWILEPYGTIEIPGWQVSGKAARRFVFTGERDSYGASLGETANLGVIEAVFFRERRPVQRYWEPREEPMAAPQRAVPQSKDAAGKSAEAAPQLSDDYAATGMGDRTQHRVHAVEIELDRKPLASVRLRYEFRPQLVKLGVLPLRETAEERRERARGFEQFCPEP
jgi:hypothetical protein